MNIARA